MVENVVEMFLLTFFYLNGHKGDLAIFIECTSIYFPDFIVIFTALKKMLKNTRCNKAQFVV